MLYIGIDLGTSSCKLLLVDEEGRVLNSVSREYPLYFPRPGWSEQEPEDWFAAVCGGIPELLRGFDASGLEGIGVAGQKDYDGRFSRENKAWAKTQPLPPDPEHRGLYCSYVVDKAHPVLTDALVTHVRRELECQKKPSVMEKLQSAETPPRSAAKAAVPEL